MYWKVYIGITTLSYYVLIKVEVFFIMDSSNYNNKIIILIDGKVIHMCVFIYIYIYIYIRQVVWDCRIFRLHLCRGMSPPSMKVLYMTLNHWWGGFPSKVLWECWVPLYHCHCSQVFSDLAWLYRFRSHLWVQQKNVFNF